MIETSAEGSAIEIRIRSAEDLRSWWLEGFPDGGMFVPGAVGLPAGTRVVVRIFTELPTSGNTVLTGTVAWRRLSAGAVHAANRPESSSSGQHSLRAGSGIAFDPSMRGRLLFLDRLSRGAINDGRSSIRYPATLVGELAVGDGERALEIQVDDVGPRGTRVRVLTNGPEIDRAVAGDRDGLLSSTTAVRLWIAGDTSGAASYAPLAGSVAWVGSGADAPFGVRLVLGSKEDRLHWARVFNRCRAEFERRFVAADRLVG